jgi:threonine/homoserine/homoserine lactone efflux protein
MVFEMQVPFVFGVIIGKQIIIWPIGFGLMLLNKEYPYIFTFFKYISAGYILWLAWRIANMRIFAKTSDRPAPGFFSGLIVHPLNPKAWALITTGFTNFVDPTSPVLKSTATVALCLFGVQLVCHPVWTSLWRKNSNTGEWIRIRALSNVMLCSDYGNLC